MNLSEIMDLYDYNCWANARILNTAGEVRPEQFTARVEHSHGSLRGTLVHILDAEEGWRTRLTDGHGTPDLDEKLFPDVAAIRARWMVEEAAMRAYLAALKDEDLSQTVHYTAGGQDFQRIVWHMLVHMIDHGTQHRSEAAAILTGFGRSPGDIHFMLWVREARGA